MDARVSVFDRAAAERPIASGASSAPATDAARAQESSRRNTLAESLAGLTPRRAYSAVVLTGLTRLVEFALLTAVGYLVHNAYLGSKLSFEYAIAIPIVALAAQAAFQALDLNTVGALRNPLLQSIRIASGWSFAFLVSLAGIFFLKHEIGFSRIWLMSWYLTGLVALGCERLILAALVRRMTASGALERRTVVVGGGSAGEDVLRELAAQKHTDVRICGVFDDRTDERSPDVVAGFPKLGTVDDLVEFARRTRIDLIIFTLPITAETRILQMLRKLWVLPIDIRLAAHTNKLRFRPRSYSWIGAVPVLDVFDKPIADWDVVLKATFDRVVGAICLVLLAPVMLAVACAVKLDSKGPILFRQKRHGFNNEEIDVYKFRSMYVDQLDYAVAKQVTRDDPRVTRVGRFIRRTSLDELPQLFNVVFRGNLSLVGPRPHAVQAKAAEHPYEQVVDGYFARHRVRPGITGWAQINGWRGETDTPEKIQKRVECDLFYIENWSLLFDVYILAMTPFALVKAENAY
ncbi:MAG: undecaprenyl-phosphate glucose phosphotransferase [Hyphomicrobiales bacterium]|nr:undecaprenyl-phosphate glucose phosphotransferase [Hyphomicrobiales bacterium]